MVINYLYSGDRLSNPTFLNFLDYLNLFINIVTLESGINIPLSLLIFGIFSRGYGLITDLKDLNFTT